MAEQEPALHKLIDGCKKENRQSQKLLYQQFYGYAMSICVRYARTEEEAMEILNDAFLKVFKKINLYQPDKPFKSWLRRILINTAIDHYRKYVSTYNTLDLSEAKYKPIEPEALGDLTYKELLDLVQKLSPGYRAVFNLYVIDGFNHEEISQKLGISVGASKSNLSRARMHLKNLIKELYQNERSPRTGS